MSGVFKDIASMPQPRLPEKLQSQPPVEPAQIQPPVTPADTKPQAQIQIPVTPADDLKPAQNQLPVAPAQNETPEKPADDQPPAQNQAPVAAEPAPPQLEAPPSETPAQSKPVVRQYKNYLQEYTQKEGLPLPVYENVFVGVLHSPMFRSTVVVNGVSYTSPQVFPSRKAAEMDAARVALLDVLKQEEHCSIDQEELILCKGILKEYADKVNAENPNYITGKGDGSGFTSSITFNGKQYVGDEGRNKKESQHLAARAVIRSLLDSDARVISKIIKSKQKMICAAKGKVNNPSNAQDAGQPAAVQRISNIGICASKENESCTGNSVSAASLVEANATPNLERLIGGSTSSKKRKRKAKKAENGAGIDAQVQFAAAVPSSQNTTSTCVPNSCVSLTGSDNAVLS